MQQTFSYLPEAKNKFNCQLPIEGLKQVFMVDGILQEPFAFGQGVTQLIGVRTPECKEELNFTNDWHIAAGTEAKLLLCDHTLSADPFSTLQQVHIQVAQGAKFELVVMQNEHNSATHRSDFKVDLAQDSSFLCTFVSLHGGRLDNNLSINLNGTGAECRANGIFLADGTQNINFHLDVKHLAPHCSSYQLFKGILDDQAKATFEGLVHVAKGAQKTQAYQANHNLLLTKECKIFSRPHLEIYADDVKCSHGSTVGRLDESALFYLRSRGIGLKEARLLQQLAFLDDVLAQITMEPLRKRLLDLVEGRLRGAFSQCADCSIHCC